MHPKGANASILVATGGSIHSDITLACAAHLAAQTDTALAILTVMRPGEGPRRADAVRDRVAATVSSLLPAGRVSLLVRSGRVAQRIVAETEAGGHWLAVVGDRRHHSLWTRYLLGPVSQQVIEHAACPVVVAKGQVGSVRRVLICDSGYPQRPLIPRIIKQLAPLLASVAAITVLHVMSQMAAGPGVESRDLDAAAAELVEEHAPEGELLSHDLALLTAAGYQAAVKVRHGLVVDEVLAEAHEGAYDLVIVGAHPGAGWRRILLDDVARRIVAGLDRPVAVVR